MSEELTTEEIWKAGHMIRGLKTENAKLREYVRHERDCSLSYFQAYDPEKGFKYGTKRSSKGEWVKQPPACNCGLDDALKVAAEPAGVDGNAEGT